MTAGGAVRVGIGGWVFEPWRDNFYPAGLPQKRELDYASRKVTTIEINGTYYGSQKPESFTRWHDETPEGFVFALKGPRFTTNRRVLAEAGASVERFLTGGLINLKHKLGPINWQFLPTKAFDPADFESFLKLLPKQVEERPIRHVVEVRHPSFRVPEFIALLRAHEVGVVVADSSEHPQITDVTAPFVYARLQNASEDNEFGYSTSDLGHWARRARTWSEGGIPDDLDPVGPPPRGKAKPRDVFLFMINGFKPKAPAAAMALIEQLSGNP